jgi:hypothetical protein
MKKKSILIAGLFLLAMSMVPSCDLIEECGTCSLITEENGQVVDEGAALPFCGDDLKERKNSSPVTVAGVTTYWECN